MLWSLVAFVPGLLMLVTSGLGRLETGLNRDTVTASDVAEFLEQAEAVDVGELAREGMPTALACLHRRRAQRLIETAGHQSSDADQHAAPLFLNPDEQSLPTRWRKRSRANPQFGPTRHTNRV